MVALASTAFKTEFAVDMTCQNLIVDHLCVDAVHGALKEVDGIDRYDVELEKKRVTITGKTPPSHLLAALKGTHRQVLVRGSGAADGNSEAAISILEAPHPIPFIAGIESVQIPGMNEEEHSQKVFGVARYIQIAPKTILMDLTVRLTPHSEYSVYVSKAGNVVDPPRTTGGALLELGKLKVDGKGYGDMFKEVDGQLWEWIGRATVLEKLEKAAEGKENVFAGVVARSAGTWGNDKTICACSGKTMWEEGREMEAKGML